LTRRGFGRLVVEPAPSSATRAHPAAQRRGYSGPNPVSIERLRPMLERWLPIQAEHRARLGLCGAGGAALWS